jgi:hypothetical protein
MDAYRAEHRNAGLDLRAHRRAFANLLQNLGKYTPSGTRAEITATIDGEFVRVVVDDNDPGLPSGDPAGLFDKFQRGNTEGSIAGSIVNQRLGWAIDCEPRSDVCRMRRAQWGESREMLGIKARPSRRRRHHACDNSCRKRGSVRNRSNAYQC